MPNPQFMPGPRPAKYTLVERLLAMGFPQRKIDQMPYRQKYAICRDYEQREARKATASPQLTLGFEE